MSRRGKGVYEVVLDDAMVSAFFWFTLSLIRFSVPLVSR